MWESGTGWTGREGGGFLLGAKGPLALLSPACFQPVCTLLETLSLLGVVLFAPLLPPRPQVDRMFLLKYMPRVTSYLSYRIVDVSSIKELSRRWFPNAYRWGPGISCGASGAVEESLESFTGLRRAWVQVGGWLGTVSVDVDGRRGGDKLADPDRTGNCRAQQGCKPHVE